ncbi:Hypothetical predicted protein [Mytilus galloprovincialis]|uniref:Uncharacterized protein n=1 Tax=Mytilus galloprovincialis TaxID=29158 RepID=A0A8B6DTT1_MYTGA|nr:Hypothetical predicted protein [Mytilus galloprovincialis]
MDENFMSLFNNMSNTTRERGTLNDVSVSLKPSILDMSSQYVPIKEVCWDLSDNIFVPKMKDAVLSDCEIRLLSQMYSTLYQYDFIVCPSVKVCKTLYLNGTLLGCEISRSVRSSYITAYWCNNEGTIDTDNFDLSPHPGQIVQMFKHSIIVNGETKTHFLVKVNWYKNLPASVQHYYGKPIEIWSSELFVQEGPALCIPVHRIKCRNLSNISCNNLEDEDIKSYFDRIEDNLNDSYSSDNYSDVEFDIECHESIGVDQEHNSESDISQITYWFCKLLLLWQCVMYIAFFNLPRDQRFRRENVLLVGVIPDMKTEPKTNTFVTPLVQELKKSWSDGFQLFSNKSPLILKCFKLILICVGCDIPASRKLCGFLGHAATSGCNKCKKKFPGTVGEKNCGGFDRLEWLSRDNESIVKNVVL